MVNIQTIRFFFLEKLIKLFIKKLNKNYFMIMIKSKLKKNHIIK